LLTTQTTGFDTSDHCGGHVIRPESLRWPNRRTPSGSRISHWVCSRCVWITVIRAVWIVVLEWIVVVHHIVCHCWVDGRIDSVVLPDIITCVVGGFAEPEAWE